MAREWHEKFYDRWTPGHAATLMKRLEREVFPWLGTRPIGEVRAPELLSVLRRVESRGTLDTAHRIKILAGQVFRYAIATGRAERDPTGDLAGALPSAKPKHRATSLSAPRSSWPLWCS